MMFAEARARNELENGKYEQTLELVSKAITACRSLQFSFPVVGC